MKNTTELNEVLSNSLGTVTHMSEIAFASIERLTELNLAMARESLQQAVAASMSINRSQNGKDQDKLLNPLSGADAERVTAYVRGVQKICSETQLAFAELIQRHMSSFSMNGPMSFPGMVVFAEFAQRTADLTKSAVRTATEATEKLAATTSQQVRKSA